ncbi:separin protein, partial [Coemansia nantahalensis]
LSRDAGDIRAFEDRIHAALEVTKSQPRSDSPYVLGVVADCYAWQAIAAIEAAGGSSHTPDELRACTRLWTLVSRHAVSDSGEPPDVGYLHGVVHTIQQTADLLMSRRLYAPGANVLLVAVELATACERHDRTWAPVAMECLVGLGTACLLRGDAGAAGAYFGDVATRYETGVLPPHVEVASKIAYGSFQLAQGDAAAARTTMGVAGGLARRTLDATAGPGAGAARQKREAATPETLVLLSRAAHTYSVLALKEGALADSIDFGIHSYRILTSLLRSLAAAHRRALRAQSLRAPSGDTEDDPFSDPPPGPTGDAKSEADADAAKDDAEFVAFSGNWQLQRLLIDVLAHLADVFSVRGSTKEADYFLKRALELSAQVQAPLQEEHLRLRETSILSRKSLRDECAAALHSLHATTTAAAMAPDEVAELPAGAIAAADALVVEGDAWYRCGSYTQAQAAYAQALRLVERAGDSAAGAAIQLPPVVSSEATPRLQRILGDVALLRPRSAGPDDCNASATVAAVVRDDIEIRQRLMSVLGGPFIEAVAATGTAATTELNQAPVYRSIDRRPDHMLLRARLAFADLQRVLAADEAWGLVLKPRRNSAKALAKSGLEALDALLVETLEAAITVGSAHVVHEGSHLLALVRAMRTAFGLAHADTAGAAGATVASIIDDCRNVTVMREAVDSMRRRKEPWDALAAESTAARRGWEPPGDSLPAILPPNWVVCGLSIDQHRDVLFVTRYAHGRQPTVLCLPMRAIAEPPADADDCGGLPDSARTPARSAFEGAYRQLRGIIAQSDETMKTGSACTTESEKRAWWDRRSLLDRRLGELLTAIEDEWLGGFRGVLEPTDAVSAADSAMHERLRMAIEQCVVGSLPRASAAKAKALELTAELCMLVYAVARRTVCRTASEEDGRGATSSAAAENDWLDVCSLLWDVYFYQGAAPPSDEDGLASFAARLADALTAPQGAYVDGTRVFYVLNPEGDLHRTQANFEAYLQQGPATWRGAVGRRPMNNECEGGL